MRTLKFLFISILAFGFVWLQMNPAHAGLTSAERSLFTLRQATTHFNVYAEAADSPDDTYVAEIGTILEYVYSVYVDTYGFSAPNDGNSVDVYIHTIDGAYGSASTSGYMELDPDLTDDSSHHLLYVPAHELFHLIQYQMFSTSYEIFTEGGARWAQDVIDADYDAYNTYTSNFDLIENMEGTATGAYGFALFWRYAAEYYSTMNDTTDPSYGIDVMLSFYNYFSSIGAGIVPADIEGALSAVAGSEVVLTDFYAQFLVAVYAKDLGDPFNPSITAPSGNPRMDFLEDEEASYPEMEVYREGDILSAGMSLSYDNTGIYYNATWQGQGWDGFGCFGNAEYNKITLDSSVSRIQFTPTDIDNENIHYTAFIQYTSRARDLRIRELGNLKTSGTTTLLTYNIPSSERYLVVVPYTLDQYPIDGDGNNFSYTVTGVGKQLIL